VSQGQSWHALAVTVVIAGRKELTLEAVQRVAWEGERVELSAEVAEQMDRGHAALKKYVDSRLADDPGALLYGVTTGPGDAGSVPLSEEARMSRPPGLWTASSFGEPLPERVVRAIVVARLANLVEGHAAARALVAAAVVAMLDGRPLPAVPARGNGGAGEILALGHLFGDLAEQLELEPKEKMALINGSPCAAALVADAALAGRGRLELAELAFASSVEAIRAPLEAFTPELGELWGDEHEADALRSFAALLDNGAAERQAYQAPVSHRVLPRVLGRVREVQAHAERTANSSLASVTDNPVFLVPAEGRPLGALISNGGYHNDRAHPALDGLAHAWADLAQLAQRHVDKLFQHPVSAPLLAGEWMTKPLHMVAAGYAEEARSLAQTTVLGQGGFGQNDLPSPAFLAWGKAHAVGTCLERVLAVLSALASQALHVAGQPPPPALAPFLHEVRISFAPIEAPRRLGPDAERLAAAFARRVLMQPSRAH
jgi:histidine ammonia-lyase